MAIGFTPKFTEEFELNNISKEAFFVLADEALRQCGWKRAFISRGGLIAYTGRALFSRNAEIKIAYTDNKVSITSTSTGNEMADLGKNKRNVKKYIEAFEALLVSFNPDDMDEKYQNLSLEFTEGHDAVFSQKEVSGFDSFLAIFIPRKGYYITPILILVNIAVFIIMVFAGVNFFEPDVQSMLQWGASFKPLVADGQWYRLFTNMFIHFGIFHLLLNMYAFAFIGILLEPLLGRVRFISAYILCGLFASIASLWWNDIVVSAGASGAIFGMYGVFVALLATDLIEKKVRQALFTSIGVFVVINLLYGASKNGIDNAAHIGGIISGLIIGGLFIPGLKKPESKGLKFGGIGVAALLCIVFVSAGISAASSDDISVYQMKMRRFADIETRALEVYKMNPDSPKEQVLEKINNGIADWHEDLKLINEMDSLELPEKLKEQIPQLKQYCNLRIESYKLVYKTVDENTEAYDNEIHELNAEIGQLINNLNKEKDSN